MLTKTFIFFQVLKENNRFLQCFLTNQEKKCSLKESLIFQTKIQSSLFFHLSHQAFKDKGHLIGIDKKLTIPLNSDKIQKFFPILHLKNPLFLKITILI